MTVLSFLDNLAIEPIEKAKDFKAAYHDKIQPGFDWKHFKDKDVSFETWTLQKRSDLADLYTVWALGKDDLRYAPTKSRVKEIPKRYLKGLVHPLGHPFGVVMRIPAIGMGNKVIILDGTHRIAWIYHKFKGVFTVIVDVLYPKPGKPLNFDQLFI